MEVTIPEKPCLVTTERGFSVSYHKRFLYSKYDPSRAIEAAIDSLQILPGTLILAVSPVLWLGLDSLLKKLPENSFVLGIEGEKTLHDFATEALSALRAKAQTEEQCARVTLLPFEQNEYIVNVLTGERAQNSSASENCSSIPHISHFRRAVLLEMSAGTQFHKELYQKLATLSQNAIASFWKNRITLTKMGRLYSRNLFKNLSNLPSSADFTPFAHRIAEPIFVFGAGESIEKLLCTVPKELIEKGFVIAVDAAGPALQSHGIKIDAVVALEGQLAIEKAYIGSCAKNSLLIADCTSRPEVTRHAQTVTYIASKYTDASFFKNLSTQDYFPPLVPPLGSVGLTAVFIAITLRENGNIPVFVSGLDFSFSLGRTHAKNTPAHILRLASSNRFTPPENYAAAFKNGAKKIIGKNGTEVFTDTALENYAKSFVDMFGDIQNVYDCASQGLALGLPELSTEKLSAYLESIPCSTRKSNWLESAAVYSPKAKETIRAFLETEEKALNRIKELLMYGQDVASCSCSLDDELHQLISAREYLFLHFPDGYKCDTASISFLKRIRGQIDFFLKDIKQSLKTLGMSAI